MSLAPKFMSIIRNEKTRIRKFKLIKDSFYEGLKRLVDESNGSYHTHVNYTFYQILQKDKEIHGRKLDIYILEFRIESQTEAKLLLLKPSSVWYYLVSSGRSEFIKFLLRKEKILKVQILFNN